MSTHTIRIHASAEPGRFDVTGAAQIEDTDSPVQGAALALKEAGAEDHDLIAVAGPLTFSPMSIGAILKPRPKALRSDFRRQRLAMAR